MVNGTMMKNSIAIMIFQGTFQSGSRSLTDSVSRLDVMPEGLWSEYPARFALNSSD